MAEDDDHVMAGNEGAKMGEGEVEGKESRWEGLWEGNKGAVFILSAELIGTTMDAMVKDLQQSGGGVGMHPIQPLFARALIIFLLSTFYMWWTCVPDFLLGKPEIRGWLILRSICGFLGLFCYYYVIHYIPLSEATIFRFLVPIPTAYICSRLLPSSPPFTARELLAGLLALSGVVIIAKLGQPAETCTSTPNIDPVTPSQRLCAIFVGLLGIFGTVGAYVSIRAIGNRAHVLVSVNYFAFLSMSSSLLALLFLPGVHFIMPSSPKEWIFLVLLGILGFALQFLLTMGLQLDRSSKATSMMYTQVVFALLFDWAIWRVVPGPWSWVGGAVVVGSTGYVALMKKPSGSGERKAVGDENVVDEESALLGAERQGEDEVVK